MAHPAAATVEIVEQPAEECRFRYEMESRTNGSILGASSSRTGTRNRTYPKIRLNNYVGPVQIHVSCVTKDAPYRPHPHKLVGRAHCKNGVFKITANITELNPTVEFPNIGIQCTKRNNVLEALEERGEEGDPFGTGFDPRTYATPSLHYVRLAFKVLVQDAAGHGTVPLDCVTSRIITDHRRLCVVFSNRCSGVATGGSLITLLTDKLCRGVSVHFFEEATGWRAPATIILKHYMHAIVIETPPYRDPCIRQSVNVSYYLSRPASGDADLDGGCTSELWPFMYTPARINTTKGKRLSSMLLHPDLDSPVANPTSSRYLEIPPPSYGQPWQDPEGAHVVTGPSTRDPLDWLKVGLIYPELQVPKVPLQSVAAGQQNESRSTPRGRVPSTPMALQTARSNNSSTGQSHGLEGQIGHDTPGLNNRPIIGHPSHAPMEQVYPNRAYLPMRKYHDLRGQMGHGSPGRSQPTIGQLSAMDHPILSQTPIVQPPMSQSYCLGRQMGHGSRGLSELTIGQPFPMEHPVQSYAPTESHDPGGQMGHDPSGLNHYPVDYCPGLDHGPQIGHNEPITFVEQNSLGLLPQEGHQEIMKQKSVTDLNMEALAWLFDAQSTDPASCELMSLSSLEEEISINLSDSMSRLATTESEFNGASKDPKTPTS